MTDRKVNSKLDPNDALLIFGDLQSGIVDLPLTVDPRALLNSAKGLAQLGKIYQIPALAFTIPKRRGGRPVIAPEITETLDSYVHLERTTPDSFENEAIREAIAGSGRNTLIVCGVATEIVVQWLVLSGIANGYQVYLIVDACGGLGERSEAAALRRFEAAGVIMSSVVSLAGELSGDFSKPIGQAAIDVVYELVGQEN